MAGLTNRVIAAWRDPVASFHEERDAGEPRLVAYALGASLFITLGRVLSGAAAPSEEIDATGRIAVQVFAGLSFLPLALYAVAALITLICRLFGGDGGWREGRVAFFWSGFAAGPAALIAHGTAGLAAAPAIGGAVAGLVWLLLLAPMLATSHGFARRGAYFAVVVIAVVSFAISAID